MTLQTNEPAAAPVTDGVLLVPTINGFEITVPKGTLVIRAAELLQLRIRSATTPGRSAWSRWCQELQPLGLVRLQRGHGGAHPSSSLPGR